METVPSFTLLVMRHQIIQIPAKKMRGTALFLNDLFMKRPEHVGLFLVGICTGEVWLESEVVARLCRVPHLPVVCA